MEMPVKVLRSQIFPSFIKNGSHMARPTYRMQRHMSVCAFRPVRSVPTCRRLLNAICDKFIGLRGFSRRVESVDFSGKKLNNILLMGSPGSGKTSVAKLLAPALQMHWVDADDDILEPTWGMSVAKKLSEVGSKEFLEQEAQAFLKFAAENTVISLTGSQPLMDHAMAHAHKLGIIVYLDVHNQDILDRLYAMKVNRIVGQEGGVDIATILNYRQQFYERHYDIRVMCERNENVQSVTNKVIQALKRHLGAKGYSSTRSQGSHSSFMDVTVQGLAPDRGLYVSTGEVPFMTIGQWQRLVGMSYNECALRILEQWIPSSEISCKDLRSSVSNAYTHENFQHKDIAPVIQLGNNQYLLELFHGPTGSFKDLPLQLTARLFDYAVKKFNNGMRSLILVATSGDTGSAVLNAFSRNTDTCEVVVLFPENGVSTIQKAQMTSLNSERTHVMGVLSDFDYCQSIIKDIFTDQKCDERLRSHFGYNLSAANSINFARLLPQIVYHAWSYLLMVCDGHVKMGDPVDICVPTGNFGNILGAYYAKQMGIPFRRMTIASNSNNVLHEFFTTGVYDVYNRKLLLTNSPAIDILKSSNLERYLFSASGYDFQLMSSLFRSLDETGKFSIPKQSELFIKVQQDFNSGWCSDEDSRKVIKSLYLQTGYLIDPHTAVAKCVADNLNLGGEVPVVISSTAHYSKFADGILEALGIQAGTSDPAEMIRKVSTFTEKPCLHKSVLADVQLPRYHKTICEPDKEVIMASIHSFLDQQKIKGLSSR